MTVQQILKDMGEALEGVSDAPRLEAERLLLHVLQQSDSSWLIAHGNSELSPSVFQEVQRLTQERLTGKPLAYVLREWDFYGRTFMIDERTLVPRPATEELVEQALAWLEKQNKMVTVADIGTGSGVIAITLLLESRIINKELRVLATDVSEAALEVARENARRHDVEDKIEFLQGDMLEPLTGRHIDLIVSNPPYVPTAEVEAAGTSLETRGLKFEPRVALDGGTDGQDYIKKITESKIPALIEGVGGAILDYT